MAYQPEKYLADFDGLADELVFHAEATDEPSQVARACRRAGLRPGIALNPETPARTVKPYVQAFDLALVMSVHPGASGQAFIPYVLPKVKELKRQNPQLRVGIDGGIGIGTCCQAARASADYAAAASALFGKKDLKRALLALQKDAQCVQNR
jgi:ribulose-phosphate 3-epimerase